MTVSGDNQQINLILSGGSALQNPSFTDGHTLLRPLQRADLVPHGGCRLEIHRQSQTRAGLGRRNGCPDQSERPSPGTGGPARAQQQITPRPIVEQRLLYWTGRNLPGGGCYTIERANRSQRFSCVGRSLQGVCSTVGLARDFGSPAPPIGMCSTLGRCSIMGGGWTKKHFTQIACSRAIPKPIHVSLRRRLSSWENVGSTVVSLA